MLKLKAVVLSLVILLPTLLKVGVIGNYWANYDVYAFELCINTDKPELSCNGKCQMMEELNNVEESSDTSAETPVSVLSIQQLPATFTEIGFSLLSFALAQSKTFSNYISYPLKGLLKSVFHPPKN